MNTENELIAVCEYALTEIGIDTMTTLLKSCIRFEDWNLDNLIEQYWSEAEQSLLDGDSATFEVSWTDAFDKCTHSFCLNECDYTKTFSHYVEC